MIVLSFLFSLFFWIYLEIAIFLIALISYPAVLLPKQGRGFAYFLCGFILKALFFICFVRVKVSGRQNLPKKGRFIFISNKPNLLATFSMIAYSPVRVRFAAEEPIFKVPFLGRVVKTIGCLPVTGRRKDALAFAGSVFSALRENEPVLFYPPNLMRGTVREFREAELRFIKIAGATLVPIIIRGAEKVFPEGALISPGRVEILIEPGIPADDLDDLKAVMHKLQQSYKGAKE